MATFILNSRRGPQTFTVRGREGYVRLNGQQIGLRGWVTGSTLTCGESELEAVARRWWRAALRLQREGR